MRACRLQGTEDFSLGLMGSCDSASDIINIMTAVTEDIVMDNGCCC